MTVPMHATVMDKTANNQQSILAEQVRLLYQQARSGVLGAMFIAVVLAAVLWQVGDRSYLIAWSVAMVVIGAARYVLLAAFQRAQPEPAQAQHWVNLFTVGSACAGLGWGVAAVLLLPLQPPMGQVFITFVIGGITAAAVSYLSPVLRAFTVYVIPSLLPLAAALLWLGGFLYVGMGIMTLAYMALTWAAAVRANSAYRESFALRFENQTLVESLGRSNAELVAAIGERRRVETALDQQKERALVTLESIGDGVITTGVDGKIDYLNPVAEQLTGWSLEDARGKPLLNVFTAFDETTDVPVEDPVTRCLREGRAVDMPGNAELVHRNGRRFAIKESAAPIRDRSANTIGVVLAFRDVTQERMLTQRISYQASHDPLTGLINRREFEARLDRLLLTARNGDQRHALCYFDLDQFKIVNDTCGHTAGDELLRQLAAYVQSKVRGSDCVARLGGDEFGVLLEGCSLEKGREIADTLRVAIRDFRFGWEGRTYEIGASFGLVPITAESGSLAELLTAADSACYVAKDQGRNRVHVYEPDDKILAQRSHEMRWVARVKQALEENQLCLHYQPIRSLTATHSNGNFCEVLVRLQDDNGQFTLPGVFLPAAERYGLMPAVDRWVIRATLAAMASGSGKCDKAVSINLSGQSLNDPQFLNFVVEQFNGSGIDPERVCFEITETAAIANLVGATRFIAALRAMGCRFALDDFGSGLSSFAYLKNLSVDYLKISGDFVRGVVTDPIDRAMVESINQIGHVMGLITIAECVETEAVANMLREIGVDMIQGYYVAQPESLGSVAVAVAARLAGGAQASSY
jgi:diguanylate cyclase (GGDEF)-like protein/PAS domain S-box-containing protein